MSLGFTIIGALIFSMIRGHEANVPQEAIIGISYAVASAAVIVVMSKALRKVARPESASWSCMTCT